MIAGVVAWVKSAIAADRKVTALKQLQGHVWRTGFEAGQVRARGRQGMHAHLQRAADSGSLRQEMHAHLQRAADSGSLRQEMHAHLQRAADSSGSLRQEMHAHLQRVARGSLRQLGICVCACVCACVLRP